MALMMFKEEEEFRNDRSRNHNRGRNRNFDRKRKADVRIHCKHCIHNRSRAWARRIRQCIHNRSHEDQAYGKELCRNDRSLYGKVCGRSVWEHKREARIWAGRKVCKVSYRNRREYARISWAWDVNREV